MKKVEALEEATKGPERFLFDIGRSQTTAFDPKTKMDTHYNFREKYRTQKRLGATRPMSADIGSMAWGAEPQSRAANVHATKTFYDKSHIVSVLPLGWSVLILSAHTTEMPADNRKSRAFEEPYKLKLCKERRRGARWPDQTIQEGCCFLLFASLLCLNSRSLGDLDGEL